MAGVVVSKPRVWTLTNERITKGPTQAYQGECEVIEKSAYDNLKAECDDYRAALEEIEMAPRISHKDSLLSAILGVARQALEKWRGE